MISLSHGRRFEGGEGGCVIEGECLLYCYREHNSDVRWPAYLCSQPDSCVRRRHSPAFRLDISSIVAGSEIMLISILILRLFIYSKKLKILILLYYISNIFLPRTAQI